ncbi:hypothetical protein [Arsenicibacter rosenii]|nr:hypothetical protein [Arsenicibacter rosenii]
MNICHRLEFCANNECLAALEGRWPDFHYMVRGASFLVLPARKLLKAENYRVTYDQLGKSPEVYNPEGVSDPVRIELSTYSWVGLLQFLSAHPEWYTDGIHRDLLPVETLTAEGLAAVMKTVAGCDYAT